MPISGPKIGAETTPEAVPEALDFAELQRQKEILFEEIEGQSLNLSTDQKGILTTIVLGHSIKDGFELAKRLGVSGRWLANGLSRGMVVSKHRDFARKFSAYIEANHQLIDLPNVPSEYDNNMRLSLLSFNLRQAPVQDENRTYREQAGPLASKIDNYYLNFIKNRRVAPRESLDSPRTQVEKTAEEHLRSVEAVLKESYYTGPIRKILGLETEKSLEDVEDVGEELTNGDEEVLWALRSNIIDRKTVEDLFVWKSIDINDERIQRELSEARYAPSRVVFEERKKTAESGLLKQITQSLIKRGYKESDFEIKNNGEFAYPKERYEVIDLRSSGSNPRDMNHLKRASTLPTEGASEFFPKMRDARVHEVLPERVSQRTPLPGNYLFDREPYGELAKADTYGPYDEINVCYDSMDELVFYARRGNQHIMHVGSTESAWASNKYNQKLKKCCKIVEHKRLDDGRKTHSLLFETSNPRPNEHLIVLSEEGSYQGCGYFSKMIDFSEIDGKLFEFGVYEGKIFFIWNEGAFVVNNIPVDSEDVQVHRFHNRAVITDGKTVLMYEYSVGRPEKIEFEGKSSCTILHGRLFFIESPPDGGVRFWEYSEGLKLKECEQRDLDLANAVDDEHLTSIEGYFEKYYPDEAQMPISERVKLALRDALSKSKGIAHAVNQTIRHAPELFLNTLSAKDDKPTQYLMQEMFDYIFPGVKERRERMLHEAQRASGASGRGTGTQGRRGENEVVDYDSRDSRMTSVDDAGYREMVADNREVLKMRESLPQGTFIIQNVFGNYSDGSWSKVNVPISQEIKGPAREMTFEFVDEKASEKINLPRIAGANIIPERLKGVTESGVEVLLDVLEKNNLGEVRVKKGAGVKQLIYSQSVGEVPKTMAELTPKDYEKFRANFEKSFGEVMTKKIGDVGEELDIFIRSISDKSPREQVIAIQEFCYQYGFYNFDSEVRETGSLEDRLAIMEGRMDKLKIDWPELAGKKFAGICTDYANLTSALLRRAGFVSGVASGFVPEEGSLTVRTARGHAVAYVLWPNPDNKEGKPDLIIVDGTPTSATPKIAEQEARAEVVHKGESGEAEKKMVELENVLKTLNVEEIKKLSNGVLERMLNAILYGIKQDHVEVLSRVLNASRYAGFDVSKLLDRSDVASEIEFRKFLEQEVKAEKSILHENRERRGEELFELITDFSQRYKKDFGGDDKEAFDVLDRIFDAAKGALNPIESRSVSAIVTYLRAQKMRGR